MKLSMLHLIAFTSLAGVLVEAQLQVWFSRVHATYLDVNIKACSKRNGIPPNDGDRCSTKVKTCFFGSQLCPDGREWPRMKCVCSGGEQPEWQCTRDIPCPDDTVAPQGDTPVLPSDVPSFNPSETPTLLSTFPTFAPSSGPVMEEPETRAPVRDSTVVAPSSVSSAEATGAPITLAPATKAPVIMGNNPDDMSPVINATTSAPTPVITADPATTAAPSMPNPDEMAPVSPDASKSPVAKAPSIPNPDDTMQPMAVDIATMAPSSLAPVADSPPVTNAPSTSEVAASPSVEPTQTPSIRPTTTPFRECSDEDETCCDVDSRCSELASTGGCTDNPEYAIGNCQRACGICGSSSSRGQEAEPPNVNNAATPVPNFCINNDERCDGWAASGECDANPAYMLVNCERACGYVCDPDGCKDKNSRCSEWASRGECSANPAYMLDNCEISCGECGCKDQDSRCELWSSIGECSNNPAYMLVNCQLSCAQCVGSGRSPSRGGSWEGPFRLPIVPAAAANLPDGKILLWSGKGADFFNDGTNAGQTYTTVFDPSTLSHNGALIVRTDHDMFCPGTAVLSDSRIVVTGGNHAAQTTIYDPRSNTWSRGATMNTPRGYHSMTVLSDGSIFTIGGSWNDGKGGKDGEVWSLSNGETWSRIPNARSEPLTTQDVVRSSDNHYWLFTAPNGDVFHAGPAPQMHWINIENGGTVTRSLLRGDDQDAMHGNAVMYDIGMILTLGGGLRYVEGQASSRAYVIDIRNAPTVEVQRTGSLKVARSLCNSVVLPNGHVVVIGGMTSTRLFSDQGAIYSAEIWNPTTGQFQQLSNMKVPRVYHSAAILGRDGRIIATGGGLCGDCDVNHPDAEILTPPYLLNADGTPKVRPKIEALPKWVEIGQMFEVQTDTNGEHTFAMVRSSAVTHSVNNDMRRIPLRDVVQVGKFFELTLPANPSVALPGTYFLFAMNADGVPSVGGVISILPP